MYEQVADKRNCRDQLRQQLDSDDPDEEQLSEALSQLSLLRKKYGDAMRLDEESDARDLHSHIIEELSISSALEKVLRDTSIDPNCIPRCFDTEPLMLSIESLKALNSGGAPRKLSSRDLVNLSSFTCKFRSLATRAVDVCVSTDRTDPSVDDPWADFHATLADRDDALDISNQGLALAVSKEIDQCIHVLSEYNRVVIIIKASLEHEPCPTEEILREALEQAESFECAKLTESPMTGLEVARVKARLERVLKEKALLASLASALQAERLGPAEQLPPGLTIATQLLDNAIQGCTSLGISHPDDKKVLCHAMYTRKLRAAVKNVVSTHKRWRRSIGDEFVAANATLEELDVILQEMPTDLEDVNKSDASIAQDVSLRFSVVDEVFARLQAACKNLDEGALTHSLYQVERLGVADKSESWKELVLSSKGVLQSIEELRKALENGIRNCDGDAIESNLAIASDMGYATEVVSEARNLLGKIRDIERKAKDAIWSLDREADMLPLVRRASGIGYHSEELDLLRSYLALPLDQFLERQLANAEKAKNFSRRVETCVYLHDVIFDSARNSYDFFNCKVLRSKDEWVKRRFDDPIPDARTRKKMDKMLEHECQDLKNSLTKLTKPGHVALALLQFKSIQIFMGDRHSMYRDVCGDEVVSLCLKTPELQDETYCQMMKQLSCNPCAESDDRGWILLKKMIAKFPPSEDLAMYLESFMRRQGRRDDMISTLIGTVLDFGVHWSQNKSKEVKVGQMLRSAGNFSESRTARAHIICSVGPTTDDGQKLCRLAPPSFPRHDFLSLCALVSF